jgi:hypothetical protein
MVMLSIVSSLTQIICHYFNYDVLYHNITKLHFHRTMALNFALFSAIHTGAHIYMWVTNPYFEFDGKRVYSIDSPTFVTGVGALLAIAFSTYVGIKRLPFKLHIYSAIAVIVSFRFHGSQQVFGEPYGARFVTITLIGCSIIYIFLTVSNRFVVVPIISMSCFVVQVQIPSNPTLVFLVVEPPLTLKIRTGNYYNLYGTKKSWRRFDSHTVSVFHSPKNPRLLAFLYVCGSSERGVAATIRRKVLLAYPFQF